MKITVFTPTYNRAYIIEILYHSLQRQTYRDFEWLIVDDGSSDNTEEIISGWQNEGNDFPIRYYKKENGGKCSAINWGLDLAEGLLFFNVDSDDYLTDDALEKISKWEEDLPKDEKYCGVVGNLGTSEKETSNSLFEGSFFEGTFLDRYKNVDGERAIAFYTEVHKKYKYPKFSGENFMTEAVVWNRIAHDGYKTRFYNDIIWIYEYKDDGLTKAGNTMFVNNPRGYGLWLREKAEFTKVSFIQKLRLYYNFVCELGHLYDDAFIAECIGAPPILIGPLRLAHNIINKIKDR